MGRYDIIGPYWFEDADGRPITVYTEWYIELMRRIHPGTEAEARGG